MEYQYEKELADYLALHAGSRNPALDAAMVKHTFKIESLTKALSNIDATLTSPTLTTSIEKAFSDLSESLLNVPMLKSKPIPMPRLIPKPAPIERDVVSEYADDPLFGAF